MKVGLDDFFAAGHSVNDLLALATTEFRYGDNDDCHSPYAETEEGLVLRKETANGPVIVPLTNFTARVISDIVEDDGTETSRVFEVEVTLRNSKSSVRGMVSAALFSAMRWVVMMLGARALIYPYMTEHARAAVQSISTNVHERRIFTHTGWRKIDGEWCYLHGAGALSSKEGRDLEVRLPEALSHFILPQPPTREAFAESLRLSLKFLDVASDYITIPLLGAAFAAVLGGADFSVHLTGPTGTGKSELAALVQQLYGAGFDARHLPANWSSTGNSLEVISHAAKDSVLVIDDFAPTGTAMDVARLHREADRILRAQGNHSGRTRLRSDATLRPAKPPRGLIISTGEDVPRGQSLRARIIVLEVGINTINWRRLTECQTAARDGVYALAMAGFLHWLSPRYEDVCQHSREELALLRDRATCGTIHKRTPAARAHLARAWDYLLRAARDVGLLTPEEIETYQARIWAALDEVAGRQEEHHQSQEPTQRFFELLISAIASGQAHVASVSGNEPQQPEAWGWRSVPVRDGFKWREQGERVGWIEGSDQLYLEPSASYVAAQKIGNVTGEPLHISTATLRRRLHERKFLVSTGGKGRRTLTTRRTVEGRRLEVLHIRGALLLEGLSRLTETDQADQSEGEARLREDEKISRSGPRSHDNQASISEATLINREISNDLQLAVSPVSSNLLDKDTCSVCDGNPPIKGPSKKKKHGHELSTLEKTGPERPHPPAGAKSSDMGQEYWDVVEMARASGKDEYGVAVEIAFLALNRGSKPEEAIETVQKMLNRFETPRCRSAVSEAEARRSIAQGEIII